MFWCEPLTEYTFCELWITLAAVVVVVVVAELSVGRLPRVELFGEFSVF